MRADTAALAGAGRLSTFLLFLHTLGIWTHPRLLQGPGTASQLGLQQWTVQLVVWAQKPS
ncbi:hypothetical protein BU16DRAFT_522042 [Lophium mytilinum]|uniref:Uncharacterized protein n=1 Tax=Lophium mytilinum TaxID=390894 RepID=A0A6A6R999_9PEZI|nr:hypothetical protein BU16DRAFT_522042 [Lophium mytilinum]